MDNLTLFIRTPEYPISEASSVFGSFNDLALILGLICVVILLTLGLSVCHKTITACITVHKGPGQVQKAMLRRDSVFLSIVEEEFQHQIEHHFPIGDEAKRDSLTTKTTTKTKEVPESIKKKGIRQRASSVGRDDNSETDNAITTKTKKKKKKTLVRFSSQRPSTEEDDGARGVEGTASIARFAASLKRSQTAPSPRPRIIFVEENPSF